MSIGLLGTGVGRLGGSPSGLSPITSILMASRLTVMGGGSPDSAGVDTGANNRITFYNVCGATVTKLRCYWINWKLNNGTPKETNNANNITITASVEYPAGTFNQVTFGGATSKVLAPGDTVESDEITLSTPIPTETQFWVRTYITVSSGQVWQTGYIIQTGKGEANDHGTTTSDLTMSGSITNVAGLRGYGPVGIKATAFQGSPRRMGIVGIGDSIVQGATDGNFDTYVYTGAFGRAFGSAVSAPLPFANFGVSGTNVQTNQPANLPKTLALIAAMGATHVVCDWGVNDIIAGRTLLQLQTDLQASWNGFVANGQRVIHSTITPRTSSTDSWATTVNQTINGAGFTGSPSIWSQLNDWIRGKPSPIVAYLEVADAATDAHNDPIWNVNGAWTNHAYTTDGLHPSFTATNQGGVFPIRDAIIAASTTWAQSPP